MEYKYSYPKKYNKTFYLFILVNLFFIGIGVFCILFPSEDTVTTANWVIIAFLSLPASIIVLFTVLIINGYIHDRRIKNFTSKGKEEKAKLTDFEQIGRKGLNGVALCRINLTVTDDSGNSTTYRPKYIYSIKMVEQMQKEESIPVYILNGKCLPFPKYIQRYTEKEQMYTPIDRMSESIEKKLSRYQKPNKYPRIRHDENGVEVITAPKEAYEKDSTHPVRKVFEIAGKTIRIADIIKGVLIGIVILALLIWLIVSLF